MCQIAVAGIAIKYLLKVQESTPQKYVLKPLSLIIMNSYRSLKQKYVNAYQNKETYVKWKNFLS